jgi:N,N-dimethylformamidase
VRPAQPSAKLCFLMPTVSFQCYENMAEICPANARQADGSGSFGGTTWLTVTATGALLHQLPSQHCLGRCTYDHHNDGDGVKYVSTLRPSLLTRPNEPAWQFPAEAHILGFLEENDIDYDIVTDHQLHAEGADAIRPYTAVLSGTHPEYYSKPMLDAVTRWTQREGGRFVSLGANGFYWNVAFPT